MSQLRSAIKAGTFPDLLGTVGELDAQRVRLEVSTRKRAEELRTFRVHPQYAEYQDQANELQSAIRQLNQENTADGAMLAFYRESLEEEQPADSARLAKVYQEAGVGWPDGVKKRLEDVQAFHEQLVTNRRAFLESEITRLTRAISLRSDQIRAYSDRRAELLQVLDSYGALAEYAELQRLQTQETAKLSAVYERIGNMKRIDEIKSQSRLSASNCTFWPARSTKSDGPNGIVRSRCSIRSRRPSIGGRASWSSMLLMAATASTWTLSARIAKESSR